MDKSFVLRAFLVALIGAVTALRAGVNVLADPWFWTVAVLVGILAIV